MLKRYKLRRRKITRVEKKELPKQPEVSKDMGAIKTNILVNNLSASQVFNMDETGVNQGLGPTHMYVPKSTARASQPTTDVKARITDVVTVSANGEFAPNMFILKHYEKS